MKYLVLVVLGIFCACGTNIFKPVAKKDSDQALIEEARNLLDKKKYEDARTTLEKVEHHSNEKAILLTSATLGEAGLALWDLIIEVADNTVADQGNGIDNFFNLISETVFGEGETRVLRLAALSDGIEILKAAPEPEENRVEVLRCFLAGIIAQPAITDSNTAIAAVTTALNNVQSSATGSGGSAAECPNLADFSTSLAAIDSLHVSFTQILEAAANCSFLDFSDSAADLNTIQRKLNRLMTAADKGCDDVPACGNSSACQALGLGCVSEVLDAAPAASGDGVLSSCEIVKNCLNPADCFGS